jgi:hypothetical protein
VSKVTLDIIAETAFGYQVNSVLNPHNELAEAYETLVNLQTGMLPHTLYLMVIGDSQRTTWVN